MRNEFPLTVLTDGEPVPSFWVPIHKSRAELSSPAYRSWYYQVQPCSKAQMTRVLRSKDQIASQRNLTSSLILRIASPVPSCELPKMRRVLNCTADRTYRDRHIS